MEARDIYLEELSRSRAGFNPCPDPNPASSSQPASALTSPMENLGLENLKRKFPFLREYSDAFIQATGVDVLIKAETASMKMKDFDRSRKAEEKLLNNRESMANVQYNVEAGKDNRLDLLHDARFLPGAACSAGKLWLQARKVIGAKGHSAISSYDMSSFGLGGCVSAKGWVELHNPSSNTISIRMFSMGSSASASLSRGKNSKDDEIPDMEDLSEFKNAVRVLKGAMHTVHPWNRSVDALESFLVQTNYCATELASLSNQVSTLSKFVDYILSENANRWRDMEIFLNTREIRLTWADFASQKLSSIASKGGAAKNQKQGQQQFRVQGQYPQSNFSSVQQQAAPAKQQGQQFNNQTLPSVRHNLAPFMFLDDICVKWNLGRCIRPPGTCVTLKGKPLRHVCNFRPDVSKPHISCGKDHPATLFH